MFELAGKALDLGPQRRHLTGDCGLGGGGGGGRFRRFGGRRLRRGRWLLFVEHPVELQHVHAGRGTDDRARAVGVGVDQGQDPGHRQGACGGDAAGLVACRLGADVGVEAAARGGHQVGGNEVLLVLAKLERAGDDLGLGGRHLLLELGDGVGIGLGLLRDLVLGLELGLLGVELIEQGLEGGIAGVLLDAADDVHGDPLPQRRVLGAEVRSAGGVGGVAVGTGGGGTGVEVGVGGERLGDQLRADDGAVAAVDEASLGLFGEEELAEAPDRRRIGDGAEDEADDTRGQGVDCLFDQHGPTRYDLVPENGCTSQWLRSCRPGPGAGRWRGRSA